MDFRLPQRSKESPTMHTLTFDEIEAIAARHATEEAARNTPKAVAIRAIYTLRSVLADLSEDDRAQVARLAAAELAPFAVQALQVAGGLTVFSTPAGDAALCLMSAGAMLDAIGADCLAGLETV